MLKLLIRDDEGHETVVPLVRQEITIGRQPGNMVRLTERNVSRRHARLSRQNGTVFLEDLSSANGTQVNGERLQEQVALRVGDRIRIGDYELSIRLEQVAADTPHATGRIHGPPPVQLERPRAQPRKWLAVVLALLVLALLVIAVQASFNLRPSVTRAPVQPIETVAQLPAPPPQAPSVAPAAQPTPPALAQPTPASVVTTEKGLQVPEAMPPGQAQVARKVREPKKTPTVKLTAVQEKIEPEQPLRLYQEGSEQVRNNELSQAVSTLNRCLALDPSFANCHRLLGATYARLKDPEQGAIHYRRFVQLAPDDPEAAKVRIFLEQYDATLGLTKKD